MSAEPNTAAMEAPNAPAPGYRRLTGSTHRYLGVPAALENVFLFGLAPLVPRQRVYLGEDHLLVLERVYTEERAHRLYYRDIQGIRIQRNHGQWTAGIALALTAALLVLVMLASGGVVFVIALAPLMVPVLIALGTAAARGLRCETRVFTAVSNTHLYCLSLWDEAHDFATRVGPVLSQAQAGAREQDLVLESPPRLADRVRSAGLITRGETGIRHEPGYVHGALFGGMILLGLSVTADFFAYSNTKNIVDSLFFIALLGLCCFALARQRHSDMSEALRKTTVVAMLCIILVFYLSYFVQLTVGFALPPPQDVPADWTPGSQDSPFFQAHLVVQAFLLLSMGALGLGLVGMHVIMRGRAAPPQPPKPDAGSTEAPDGAPGRDEP